MKLSNIIFEGFRESASIINGKKYTENWIGNADTLDDFYKAVDRIPDTIQSIKVPIDTSSFNPNQKEIFPEGNWKQDIKTVGYHYYMTPDKAKMGLKNFVRVKDQKPKKKTLIFVG